jgi:hypothetical protein
VIAMTLTKLSAVNLEDCQGIRDWLEQEHRNPDATFALYMENPAGQWDSVRNAVTAAGEQNVPVHSILLVTRHLTRDVANKLHEAGFAHVILTKRNQGIQSDSPVFSLETIKDTICPLLHVVESHGVTMSVCGAHNDRMVLAPHHMNRWCLAGMDDCTHRGIKYDRTQAAEVGPACADVAARAAGRELCGADRRGHDPVVSAVGASSGARRPD